MRTFYLRLKATPNGREMKSPWGGENGRRKIISDLKNVYICP